VAALTPAAANFAGLRVAQLIESDGPGGAERVVADLAREFQASGAHSLVVLPANGEGWLERQLAGSGVAVEYFRLTSPFSPACARSLAAVFRRHDIAVAHSHEFSMAVYGAWASWLAGVQHVITMHGSRYYADRLRRRIAMRAAVACSRHLVAVSDALAGQMSADLLIARTRIATMANGVRPSAPASPGLRDELRLGPDERLLVSVGNLYRVKGHRYLLDAVARIAVRHPRVHVAVCGRGELEHALSCQARELGIAGRVHLLGLRADVASALASADIFVHPSISEGLPLALLEAMFAGCPIIASRVGEIGTALADGDAGVLVPPGDPVALSSAIETLLDDSAHARALGERARYRAVAEYAVAQMVQRYGAVYADALGGSRPSLSPLTVSPARPGGRGCAGPA
jgi:glycosyltransferase involved in cell wall biosynthesis